MLNLVNSNSLRFLSFQKLILSSALYCFLLISDYSLLFVGLLCGTLDLPTLVKVTEIKFVTDQVVAQVN